MASPPRFRGTVLAAVVAAYLLPMCTAFSFPAHMPRLHTPPMYGSLAGSISTAEGGRMSEGLLGGGRRSSRRGGTFLPSMAMNDLAKRGALRANREQWGIVQENKAKRGALKANREQWGIVKALETGGDGEETTPAPAAPKSGGLVNALYKFTRPHTIRGTILASCACVTRVTLQSIRTQGALEWTLLRTAALGLVALLCGNAYIVGINQIYDVEIDRINKPFLPVASGEMSTLLAWILVAGTGIGGLGLVYACFPPLIFKLYTLGMAFGTVYTVPPFRWKNNAALAMLSIAMVRGLLLNVGLHHASSHALSLPVTWPPQVIFISTFMTLFAIVIAICKDLPDTAGDIKYNVKTLPATIGVDKTAKLGVLALACNYGMGIAYGVWAKGVNAPLMIVAHSALAIWLWTFSRKLEPDSIPSIKLFYKNIWKLFYTEYLIYPFL